MFVSILSLTMISPRLLTSTPNSSKPTPSELAFRPTDNNAFLAISCSPESRKAATSPSTSMIFSILTPHLTSTPCFLREAWIASETSGSSIGRTVGIMSTTVTLLPRPANMKASSHPMTPPPTTRRLSGTSEKSKASSLVMTVFPLYPNDGNTSGLEPVAIITFVALISEDAPSESTAILPGATSRPVPFTTLTLPLLSRKLTPALRRETILFFLVIILRKSTDISLASTPNSFSLRARA